MNPLQNTGKIHKDWAPLGHSRRWGKAVPPPVFLPTDISEVLICAEDGLQDCNKI